MWKWITFIVRATYILVFLLLFAMLCTELSTKRTSQSSVCAHCLAHRRTVTRKLMWRVIEDRDTIYLLPDNEKVDCQHDWIVEGSSSKSGFGGQAAASGRYGDPRFLNRNAAIEDYEHRTGRDYVKEEHKIDELDRKASDRIARGTP